MALRNTSDRFGWLARTLHWLIALLLLGLIIAGLIFSGMERGPDRTELANLHKSVALLTLVLMTIRLIWKFLNPRPEHPPGLPAWQRASASIVHGLLYLAVYFQISVGILVAGQQPIGFFGLFEFGPILVQNREQHEFFEELHEIGWIVLAVLVVIHVLAALYHHIVLKNDVLKRMTAG
jgi:cytochrome b561